MGWSLVRSEPRLRVKPVFAPLPAGITPPVPVPVMGIETEPCTVAEPTPFRTFTLPIATVPSWHDRHSFELPPGCSRAPWMACASSEDDAYGV